MWFNRLCIWSSLKTTRLHWRHLAVYFLHLPSTQVAAAVGGEIFEFDGGHDVPMDEDRNSKHGKVKFWKLVNQYVCLNASDNHGKSMNIIYVYIYMIYIYLSMRTCLLFFTPFPIISKGPQCLGPKSNISNTFIYIPRLGVFDLIGRRGWVGIVNGALQ